MNTRPVLPLSRENLLASVPCLNPAVRWQELDTGEIMAVYRKYSSALGRLIMKLLCVPELAQLIIDNVGARVVRAIDGERSVSELIEFASREFAMSHEESEASLLKYLELLGQRRLIGFEIRTEPRET